MMHLNIKLLVDQKYPGKTPTDKANRNRFAKDIGVGFPAACALYEGTTTKIDFSTLEAICKTLNCTPNDILEYDKSDTLQ